MGRVLGVITEIFRQMLTSKFACQYTRLYLRWQKQTMCTVCIELNYRAWRKWYKYALSALD
jgi:hypothetical protein